MFCCILNYHPDHICFFLLHIRNNSIAVFCNASKILYLTVFYFFLVSPHMPMDYASTPGLGDDEYPGFPAMDTPDQMPDLSEHNSCMADILKKSPGPV